MARIYNRMLMYISLKRLALVEEIYNASSEVQVMVATLFVKLGHEWASSSCVFVSVRQLTVYLLEDDSFKISHIRTSVPHFIILFASPGLKVASALYHVCSCIWSCPTIWKTGNTEALCWGNIFLIKLHGDTTFNSNWFSDTVLDWVVYYL